LTAGAFIVADFGKTLSKLTLWSKDGQMLDRITRENKPQNAAQYRALDVVGIGDWLIESLKRFAGHRVEAIIPVAHGAAAVGLICGEIAFPPLDYEQPIPDADLAEYRKSRDSFAATGSPPLPDGLNLGSQLHWLENVHGDRFAQSTLLPYAQYWAWFLSGEMRSEVTSLGCHTDLWSPASGDFSPMAISRGWAKQFAPLAKAGDKIGTLRKNLAEQTGLSKSVNIHTGLHDSNAALLAARGYSEIADNDATILSTGTWFVAMRSTSQNVPLDQLSDTRDCLINIDPFGKPLPSARFMGGREIELLTETAENRVDIAADQAAMVASVAHVVSSIAMALPSFAPGNGPFPDGKARWVDRPKDRHALGAAVCLYAALVAETSLSLLGTQNILLIEGRFAQAEVFVRALASLRPDLKVYTANADNDVSFGALRLLNPALKPAGSLTRIAPLETDISDYAQRWHDQTQ
jgi:sugar (pentulose or hexulose) kinase